MLHHKSGLHRGPNFLPFNITVKLLLCCPGHVACQKAKKVEKPVTTETVAMHSTGSSSLD